ncbi:unnamed protein product, partial [Acanthoscelides obtectus]
FPRLKKITVLYILSLIEEELESVTDRNHSISPINQLLLTLRFYATGNFLLTVGDFIKVSKSSASKIVKKVSEAIATFSGRFIKMPSNDEEIRKAKSSFYEKAHVPRVIGSLDCTHIKIQSPGGNNAELFRNRKGYFSINVQTISAPNLKILDITARWPGSQHDQIIFDNSSIKSRLERNEFGNSLLVADSGYANSMHVITPLLEARTQVQQLYNEAVTRTRNPVERQYGLWKRRFPVLSTGLRLKLQTTLTVIVATAVLHNIAIDQNEEQPPDIPNLDENIIIMKKISVLILLKITS